MRFLLSFVLFFSVFTTHSQVVNIENRRVSDGTYGFSGALNFSFSAQKQKDPLYSLQFKPVIQYKFSGKKDLKYFKEALTDSTWKINVKPDKNKHLLLLINDLQYTGSVGKTYANYGLMHLRYAYRIKESAWKWESYTQIQYNQLLLQKVRAIVGTGIRAKLLDAKAKDGGFAQRAMRLFMGSSVFYEYEEIKYSDRPMEFLNTIRWSTYLSAYFNFKHVEFSFTTYIQPNLAVFKDFRMLGEYAVFFRINDPFSIRMSINHFYDARPPINVTPSTFSFSVGFTYKLDKFRIDPQKISKRKKQWIETIHEDKKEIEKLEKGE